MVSDMALGSCSPGFQSMIREGPGKKGLQAGSLDIRPAYCGMYQRERILVLDVTGWKNMEAGMFTRPSVMRYPIISLMPCSRCWDEIASQDLVSPGRCCLLFCSHLHRFR